MQTITPRGEALTRPRHAPQATTSPVLQPIGYPSHFLHAGLVLQSAIYLREPEVQQ
jgi:hypothetical protein